MEQQDLNEYFTDLLQKVDLQIQDFEDNSNDVFCLCKQVIDYLQEIIGELKAFVIAYPFANQEEEIYFFKEQKPVIASKIIYYHTVYQFELRFPNGSEETQRVFIMAETDRILAHFQRNISFYQYYRTKATYLDHKYFLRGKPDIHLLISNFYYEADPQFSTSYDYKIAKILANELFAIYLTNRLNELERRIQRQQVKNGNIKKLLRWTGTKVAAIELGYAIYAAGVLNNGNADIKEIMIYIEASFKIDLGDYYCTYLTIRERKRDRTTFLNSLIEKFLRKMDENDN